MHFSRKINTLQIFLLTHAKKSVVIHGWLASENINSVLIEILLPGGISRWIETAMVDE